MKKVKYLLAFIFILLLFYAGFTIVSAGFNFFKWDALTRTHFVLYGLIGNAILVLFYFIDDHFKAKP
jgi:hypothetical protein